MDRETERLLNLADSIKKHSLKIRTSSVSSKIDDQLTINSEGFILKSKSKKKRSYNNILDTIILEDRWIWSMIKNKATKTCPVYTSLRIKINNKTLRHVNIEATRKYGNVYLLKITYNKKEHLKNRFRQSS